VQLFVAESSQEFVAASATLINAVEVLVLLLLLLVLLLHLQAAAVVLLQLRGTGTAVVDRVVVDTFREVRQILLTAQAMLCSEHPGETSMEPHITVQRQFRHRLEEKTGSMDVGSASRSAAQAT